MTQPQGGLSGSTSAFLSREKGAPARSGAGMGCHRACVLLERQSIPLQTALCLLPRALTSRTEAEHEPRKEKKQRKEEKEKGGGEHPLDSALPSPYTVRSASARPPARRRRRCCCRECGARGSSWRRRPALSRPRKRHPPRRKPPRYIQPFQLAQLLSPFGANRRVPLSHQRQRTRAAEITGSQAGEKKQTRTGEKRREKA